MSADNKPGAKSQTVVINNSADKTETKQSNVFGKKLAGFGKSIIVGLGGKEEGAKAVIVASENIKVDSNLVQGAQRALDKVVEKPSKAEAALGVSTDLHFFSIATQNFKGYVVVAYAAGKILEKKFKETLKTNFLKSSKSQGVTVTAAAAGDARVQKVDFEKWSLKDSGVVVKSVHAGAELALSFVERDETAGSLQKSADDKMLMIPLSEIEPDDPLRFDLFLYMPTNKKFLLYAKKNSAITYTQKSALEKNGNTLMAIRAEAAEAADSYMAEQFINRKIQDFAASP